MEIEHLNKSFGEIHAVNDLSFCVKKGEWSVDWKDTCVKVTISEEEQPDHLYTLYFDGKTEQAELDTELGEWQ